MATYSTKQDLDNARKLHSSFLILKAGDSIEGALVPSIKKIQGNAATSSIKITDVSGNETFNLHDTNCVCGPFGESSGYNQISSKKVECVTGEVVIHFEL